MVPFLRMMLSVSEDVSQTVHEQIAEGNWVTTRVVTETGVLQDVEGMQAGDVVITEAIMMHKVENSVIVKQHSQGGRVDQPNSWDPQ